MFGAIENATEIILVIGVLLFALVAMGLVFTKVYQRASKEISYVRTGFCGQKVIVNGGSVVLPLLQEIIPVNMNTLRLEVRRANDQALITKDRMRVDVQAEFYVRVKPTEEAIADAAQTLGRKTLFPEQLKQLVEGKFVDALRSVAAEMRMEELHEQRVDFVQKVQRAVSEDLLKNGLELETVSLTGLDQTSKEYFNPDNAFDAQGLTRLTEEIEARRKQRNDIQQDTEVAIRQKNLDAERLKLELAKEEEYARLHQQRELEVRRAEQSAEIAQERAKKEQEAQQTEIIARREVETSKIAAERKVQEERIETERQLKEREIAKTKIVETSDIERVKTVELANQDQAIAIAEKSKAQSEAQAAADKARALAVKAEEEVVTVREREKAERSKQIALVEAAKQAEQEAIRLMVAAETDKKAALDQAAAVRTIAEAEAEKIRIAAQEDADAERLRADAAERRYAVEAGGLKSRHEADNLLSIDQIQMQLKLAIVSNLATIIAASVKPLESIEGIKILQLGGLGQTFGEGAAGSGAPSNKNLAEEVVSSALKYRAQAPLVDALMQEIGLHSEGLNGFVQSLHGAMTENQTVTAAEKKETSNGIHPVDPELA